MFYSNYLGLNDSSIALVIRISYSPNRTNDRSLLYNQNEGWDNGLLESNYHHEFPH